MKQTQRYFHPIFVFILSTAVLAISLFLYIYWYVGISTELKAIIQYYHLDPNKFFEAKTWVVIFVISLLFGVLLTGILIIFIYNLKTIQLYRLQHNFINNFTHELKTPVTSLKLYMETFLRHELPRAEQLKYIGFMLQDTERLSGNINSILNLTRIESKMYDKEFTPVDLVELIQRFLADNHHVFQDCDIRLENLPEEPVLYPVIPYLLEILLMNLLTNAMKYNTSGAPRVDITFELQNQKLFIHFRDNGIGMTKEETKKIFKKFYQSRRHDNLPVGGSGIGLYLARQIARLHSGTIIAGSEGEGKGSVLTLILPYKTPLKDKS